MGTACLVYAEHADKRAVYFFSVCPLSGQHRLSLTGAVPPGCHPVPCSAAAVVCHGLAGNPSVLGIRQMEGAGGGGPWLGLASRLRSVCRRIVSRADTRDTGDGTPVTGCARTPLPPRVECVHAAGKTCFAQGQRRVCWRGMTGSSDTHTTTGVDRPSPLCLVWLPSGHHRTHYTPPRPAYHAGDSVHRHLYHVRQEWPCMYQYGQERPTSGDQRCGLQRRCSVWGRWSEIPFPYRLYRV
jgi:hypothetical protein